MPKAGFIVARVSFLVLAASMLGVAMLAAPAVGQPVTCSSTTKCFFAVSPVAPSNPVAGTNTSFTFAIKNEASPQQLGAVQISAPTGFMITGASVAPGAPGTASFTSSSATFTNLSVASMSTTMLTVTATVPCGSGSYQWSIAAKQANNFNGSGNDFQLDPNSTSNLSGTLTGSCTAAPPCSSTITCFFAVNPVTPSNPVAGTNTSFTFTIQNEASPQQLGAVRISAPTGFMITGASVAPGAPGTASFTSSSATFTNLSLAPSSTTTLTVTATVPCGGGSYQWGIAATQSDNFNGSGNDFQLDPTSNGNLSGTITGSCTAAPPCQSSTCSASASSATGTTSVTVTTSSAVPGDVIVAGVEGTDVNYSCPTYTSVAAVVSFAIFDANGVPQSIPLTVTVRIDKSVVNMSGHPGASSWQICYASTTPFSANAVSGTYTPASDPAAAVIGGVPYNTGLLLGCPATQNTPPCVQSQHKNNAGDVIVTFLALGDPLGHP
jgi:hypothetical protein